MKEIDYEKAQFKEQEETNLILWINTVFTIITGVATLIISIMAFLK